MLFLANKWDIESNWFTDWFYSPNFIEIGDFVIAKYAVCILIGLILAYFICAKEGKRLGMDPDIVLSEMIWIVPCCILGARIWYMIGDGEETFKLFREQGYNFFSSIFRLIAFTFGFDASGNFNGISGLAIQGGIAVAFPLAYWRAKAHNYSVISILDMLAPGFLIGQICGRWGNFFNQEAYGVVIGGWKSVGNFLVPNIESLEEQWNYLTKTLCVPSFIAKNMLIDSTGEVYYYGIVNGVQTYGYIIGENFYHPAFYYEMLGNIVAFIGYFILRRRKWVKEGFLGGLYLIWYGVLRFFVEFIRCDSLYLGSITFLKMAQLTAIISVILGILLILYCNFIKKTKPIYEIVSDYKLKSKEEKK